MNFTHLTPTLTLRNQPLTVNRQWESCMSCCTHFNTSHKTGRAVMHGLCFWFKYSLQVYMTDRWNPILYIHYDNNAKISVIWKVISEFVTEKLMQLWWNPWTVVMPFCFLSNCVMHLEDFSTESIVCHLMQCVIWQFLLHNYSNLIWLVVICHWCNVDVCRDPQNISRFTSIITQHTLFRRCRCHTNRREITGVDCIARGGGY